MYYLIIVLVFITVLYSLIILTFTFGWIKIKPFKFNQRSSKIPVSIVIPFRNEAENVLNIIHDIKNQTYAKDDFELILVNDHSTDNSVELILTQDLDEIMVKLLNLDINEGKKAALQLGIENSNYELIITTDADCRIGKNWLEIFVDFYLKCNPNIIVGPVLYSESKRCLSHFQNLEFLSLIASTAGAIGISKPIMANGANLAFNKKVYSEINLRSKIASGDDIFLIHSTKKLNRKSIMFLKSKEALVRTASPKNIHQFIQQRIRWASKSIYYNDFDALFTALTVFLFNLMIIALLITGIKNPFSLTLALIAYLIKLTVDFPVLFMTSKYFNRLNMMKFYPVIQLIYPFYIAGTVILSLFTNKTWKGRIIK